MTTDQLDSKNNTITWYAGHNNYQKITFLIDEESRRHKFHLELLDVDTVDESISDIFNTHLEKRQNQTVEILYSGGIDSEICLMHCLKNNIPVRAITMRILINGFAVNTHDLYYSEKFCRENKVDQVIIDFNADKFFENGDHVRYLEPYKIFTPHVATHFWLFEQCSGFPVIGGDYNWPWHNNRILSPHRHMYACYSKFLIDNSISGIGGMINYSLESNIKFIETHMTIFNEEIHSGKSLKITRLKQDIAEVLGFGQLERRMRSYGWENLKPEVFNMEYYGKDLVNRFGKTASSISWNQKIGKALGSGPGSNDKYK